MAQCDWCGEETQSPLIYYNDDNSGVVLCCTEHKTTYEGMHGSLHTSPPQQNPDDTRPVGSALGWGILVALMLGLGWLHEQCGWYW